LTAPAARGAQRLRRSLGADDPKILQQSKMGEYFNSLVAAVVNEEVSTQRHGTALP
jgi:hypothetical protein